MPGDRAMTWADRRYAHASSRPAAHRLTGERSTPSAIGSCGHTSRTSSTIGARRRSAAHAPGIATVSGVLVATTRS
jgi:hypothetical protein